jgi:hypothetical protein
MQVIIKTMLEVLLYYVAKVLVQSDIPKSVDTVKTEKNIDKSENNKVDINSTTNQKHESDGKSQKTSNNKDTIKTDLIKSHNMERANSKAVENNQENKKDNESENKKEQEKKNKNKSDKKHDNQHEKKQDRNHEKKQEKKIEKKRENDKLDNQQGKKNNKIKNTQSKHKSKIESLKKQVQKLIKLNKTLLKNYSKKVNEPHPKVVSFLQKHQSNLNTLNQKIENNKQIINDEIKEKGKEINSLYEIASSKYDDLINHIDNIEKKVEESKHRQTNLLKNFEYTFDSKTVNSDKLNCSEADLNSVNTNTIYLEGLEITGSGINIKNGDFKLVSGDIEVTVSELFNSFKSFEVLTNMCGKNFERCKPLSEEVLQSEAEKQDKILSNLRRLEHEAKSIIVQNRKLNNN